MSGTNLQSRRKGSGWDLQAAARTGILRVCRRPAETAQRSEGLGLIPA